VLTQHFKVNENMPITLDLESLLLEVLEQFFLAELKINER